MASMLRITMVRPGRLVAERVSVPAPAAGEVLVRVKRCGVCGSDLTIYRGRHPYAKIPLVMGHEFSGVAEALGPGVRSPAPGTRVAVIPHLVCGKCEACRRGVYNFCEELRCMGAEADGAHAEFIVVPQEMVLPIPDGMSLEDAAMLEPASVGYHAARRETILPTDAALVVGAGPIGIFTAQSAKALGAREVYIADVDMRRLRLAQELGVDGTIDVGREQLAEGLGRLAGGRGRVGLYFDCVGENGRVLDSILSFCPRGSRVVVVGVLQKSCGLPHLQDFVQHELRLSGTTMYVPEDYRAVMDLMGRGAVRTSGMVSHHYPLEEVGRALAMLGAKKEAAFKVMLDVGEART